MLSISGMLGDESPVDPRGRRPPALASRWGSDGDADAVGVLLEAAAVDGRGRGCADEGGEVRSRPSPDEMGMAASKSLTPPRKRKAQDTAAVVGPLQKQKRAPRPQYTKEQEDFIWFCRDDLSMSWRKVVELYNDYWHPFEVEPHVRSESGLQSRYYRILDFPVKIRKKREPSRPELGLIPSTNRRYPWMGVLSEKQGCARGCGGEEVGRVEVDVDGESGSDERDGEESDLSSMASSRRREMRSRETQTEDADDEDEGGDGEAQHGARQSLMMDMEAGSDYASSWGSSPSSTHRELQKTMSHHHSIPPRSIYSTQCDQSALLALIRAPKISGRVRQKRDIRMHRRELPTSRHRHAHHHRDPPPPPDRYIAPDIRPDPRLSVMNLCA